MNNKINTPAPTNISYKKSSIILLLFLQKTLLKPSVLIAFFEE
jgi:hypothetical protein